MQSRIIRVLPAEHGWTLEFSGLDIRPQRFLTMEAAIAAGWDVARRHKAELHIHRHDGDVHLRSAFGDKQQEP
ncbi:DUF2188 domain-containing protein [Cupriavidus consociatus]|uniref:DUF2188 domain-containing protein n=1 Tax=Cupriavidus consociatus TaxID=2821357 RepID=UPI001AE4C712|nr:MULTISPECIES: DUF2188 domain-containing protein [unclassified Cupriavidus]MBP0621212.1 DUF2188 domain-containing protein [Cupriavidus sp. LEh25]MDK2657883.1 DUF2188 domain-containing protein [Cupriavidus sp. LEh21]